MELGPQEDQLFLATNRAGQNQRRQAVVIIGVAIVACLIAAPFARVPLPPAWAFLSVHEAALLVIRTYLKIASGRGRAISVG